MSETQQNNEKIIQDQELATNNQTWTSMIGFFLIISNKLNLKNSN